MMTDQQFYDRTLTHLVRQGRQSGTPSNCLYRDQGRSCAIGCHFPDSVYDVEMESKSVCTLSEKFLDVLPFLIENDMLMLALQKLHDDADSWDVDECRFIGYLGAANIANTHGLTPYVLQEVL